MIFRCLMLLGLLAMPSPAGAFPIDGADETGIMRLEGYRLAQEGKIAGNRLPKGARLMTEQVQLRMADGPLMHLPAVDAGLTRKVVRLLGNESGDYSLSLLDITDPGKPRYAEHQGDITRNPGSVGKLVVLLSLFQALADIYPDDIAAREKVLHDAIIVADDFIGSDHHVVPFFLPKEMRMKRRRIAVGDAANFWTWLDWMASASSNAAAGMVFKHVMLLRHFGKQYPVSRAEEDDYFKNHSRSELSEALKATLWEPLARNGLNSDKLRQGGFFSRTGKRRVPGGSSVATTRELMRYCMLMEQGRLVDRWSSLQIKRLIYITQHRIRYASSPALAGTAVYFKSGSFYKCKPEEGFVCKKYMGNALNLMNSVAIIEAPAGDPKLNYIVTVTSNVLKKNSAVAQQTLATRLHALMQRLHPEHVSPQ